MQLARILRCAAACLVSAMWGVTGTACNADLDPKGRNVHYGWLPLPDGPEYAAYVVDGDGDHAIYEGDMLFRLADVGEDRSSLPLIAAGNHGLWPGGRIPFEVDPEIIRIHSRLYNLFDAIRIWNESVPSVQWRHRNDDDRDYVEFTMTDGKPRAFVGRVGGRQQVWVDPDRHPTSTVLHEMGHAVGMIHEHSRPDRDDYVQVEEENVERGELGNFARRVRSMVYTPYDYGSIMHYHPRAFGIRVGARGPRATTLRAIRRTVVSVGEDPFRAVVRLSVPRQIEMSGERLTFADIFGLEKRYGGREDQACMIFYPDGDREHQVFWACYQRDQCGEQPEECFCETGTSRCSPGGHVIEECDETRTWSPVQDCQAGRDLHCVSEQLADGRDMPSCRAHRCTERSTCLADDEDADGEDVFGPVDSWTCPIGQCGGAYRTCSDGGLTCGQPIGRGF